MPQVIRDGQTMSVAKPREGDIILSDDRDTDSPFDDISRGGGGGSRRDRTPSRPSPKDVDIRGGKVFIDGRGFSVAPSKQAEFIRQRTGGRGSSAQQAIQQAEKRTQDITQQKQQRQLKKQLNAIDKKRSVPFGSGLTRTRTDFFTDDLERQISRPSIRQRRFPRRGEVRRVEPRGFLGGFEQTIARERAELGTRKARGEAPGIKGLTGGIGAGIATSAIGTARFVKNLATRPFQTTKRTARGISSAGQRLVSGRPVFPGLGRTIRREPGFAGGFVAGELALAKGAGAASKQTGRFATRLSPKFRRFPGEGKPIRTRSGDIRFTEKSVSELEEPISKQVSRAGRQVQPVSAQRDLFRRLTRREVSIDKPKPTKSSPELERTFFADPRGRARIKRLGIEEQKPAGLTDVLSGDVTFRRQRPQAIIFPRQRVARFPKELRGIQKKLREGKSLTPSEEQKLLDFQLTPSGQFKTPGFVSREPEITLAPGEIIKRRRKAGVTEIKGRRVPIIEAEVTRPTKRTGELITRARRGTTTPKESRELTRRLSRETGFSRSSISSRVPSRRFVSPTRTITGATTLPVSRARRSASRPRRSIPVSRGFPGSQAVSRTTGISRTITGSSGISGISRSPSQAISRAISRTTPTRLRPTPKRPLRRTKPKKKKKERRKSVESQLKEKRLFTPGFTAKALGIEKQISERDLGRLASESIGIRAIPKRRKRK